MLLLQSAKFLGAGLVIIGLAKARVVISMVFNALIIGIFRNRNWQILIDVFSKPLSSFLSYNITEEGKKYFLYIISFLILFSILNNVANIIFVSIIIFLIGNSIIVYKQEFLIKNNLELTLKFLTLMLILNILSLSIYLKISFIIIINIYVFIFHIINTYTLSNEITNILVYKIKINLFSYYIIKLVYSQIFILFVILLFCSGITAFEFFFLPSSMAEMGCICCLDDDASLTNIVMECNSNNNESDEDSSTSQLSDISLFPDKIDFNYYSPERMNSIDNFMKQYSDMFEYWSNEYKNLVEKNPSIKLSKEKELYSISAIEKFFNKDLLALNRVLIYSCSSNFEEILKTYNHDQLSVIDHQISKDFDYNQSLGNIPGGYLNLILEETPKVLNQNIELIKSKFWNEESNLSAQDKYDLLNDSKETRGMRSSIHMSSEYLVGEFIPKIWLLDALERQGYSPMSGITDDNFSKLYENMQFKGNNSDNNLFNFPLEPKECAGCQTWYDFHKSIDWKPVIEEFQISKQELLDHKNKLSGVKRKMP